MCVHPSRVLEPAHIELPGRQHDLTIILTELIPVNVDVHEIVVGSNLLKLRVRLAQRSVVPQPHVLDRGLLALQAVSRNLKLRRQAPSLKSIQVERMERVANVVLNIRALAIELVGFDHIVLQDGRVDTPEGHVGDQPQAQGAGRYPPIASYKTRQQEQRHQHRQRCEGIQRQEFRMSVRVAGAKDNAAPGVQQVKPIKPVADGPQEGNGNAQDREMDTHVARHTVNLML
ncbi:MAG: hypothetical protein MAG451_00529 [Anaerolineales bacterium]|nr:hypothetical protein [Anaerolineales bacterium]